MTGPPSAPEGHDGPIEYTLNNWILGILQVGLLIGTVRVLFPGVLSSLLSNLPYSVGEIIQYLHQHGSLILILGSAILTMVLVHEGIHYVAGLWCNHDPEFGFKFYLQFGIFPELNPYVVTLDEFINKRENIIVLAAPLVVLDTLALIGMLLPATPSLVEYLCRVVLVANTSFSVMDIYNVVKVASVRQGTLFRNYDSDGEVETVMFPPES